MNPLAQIHESADAEMQSYAGTEIVASYGATPLEYAALHKGVGVIDWAQRGLLELRGKDRLDLLQRILTQQIVAKEPGKGIESGGCVAAFLLNTKGRVLAELNVIETGESAFLEMDRRILESTAKEIDRYIIVDDVEIHSRAEDLYELGLHGPGAIETAAQLGAFEKKTAHVPVLVAWRDDSAGRPGVMMALPAHAVEGAWTALMELKVRPVGWAAFNAARIESGRPLFGIDFDDHMLPAETGRLDQTVSFTKGCYVGQEVVARMHARSQVARKIVGFRMERDELPMAGSPVYDETRELVVVGGVTSSTVSPILSNAAIGLALVKANVSAPGTALKIPAEGSLRLARVVELPFKTE